MKSKKKGPQINMAPTLNIFGFVSRFLYSGGWQVCQINLIETKVSNRELALEATLALKTEIKAPC